MRVSKFVGKKIKEDPKSAELISHKFLLRGGYIRQMSVGIFTLAPIAKRITLKIEKIIREEMNNVGGQEVLFPVVMPRDLWEEAGRYQSIGKEMLRFKDRNSKDMLLGMTHEEAVCHLIRTEVTSYRQLPVMVYQIQTKFRDEPRSRGGLIRVREFTMKDAYSFHVSKDDLIEYYNIVHKAYEKIFKRAGLNNFISVESDTGMMGGGLAHEFMAITEAGEDTLILCSKSSCGYKANREVAKGYITHYPEKELPLEKVSTPGQETIEEVASFLKVPVHQTAKAVFYKKDDGKLVFAVIRGDIEINEVKLRKIVGTKELTMADETAIRAVGCVPGYASPMNIKEGDAVVVIDESVTKSNNLVTGANEKDYHYSNFNYKRDYGKGIIADIASVREGDCCPQCNSPLNIKRGIEIGNIFQLGTKYSTPMKCQYLDKDGKAQDMIMGCYGIGVGRLLATVIEEHHDDYGPIWPMSITPFEVQLCALNLSKDNVKEIAEKLYKDFINAGVDILFDDRDEKAGFQFSEADLNGIPLRITVSPKTLENGEVEFKFRNSKDKQMIKTDSIVNFVMEKITEEKNKFSSF